MAIARCRRGRNSIVHDTVMLKCCWGGERHCVGMCDLEHGSMASGAIRKQVVYCEQIEETTSHQCSRGKGRLSVFVNGAALIIFARSIECHRNCTGRPVLHWTYTSNRRLGARSEQLGMSTAAATTKSKGVLKDEFLGFVPHNAAGMT